jgi:Cd2+/Zn2+-exporting ATPase
LSADLNFASGLLLIEYDTENDPRAKAVGVVVGAGHGVEPLDAEEREHPVAVSSQTWLGTHRSEVAVAASGALIVVAWALGLLGAEMTSKLVYLAAIIAGGQIMWRRAITSLTARTLDMNVLMVIAVSGAAAIGEWGEGAAVTFLFALGGVLEARSLSRTRRSIRELLDLTPARARVRRDGRETEVEPASVAVGEIVVVRPGERVPLDGELVEGTSAFDESPITGESVPAERAPGDQVFAGSLNTAGLVAIRTTAPAEDTTLARIVHLVEVAQAGRAPAQRFVDRFSRIYTPVVIVGALVLAIGVPVVGQMTGAWPGFEAWRDWTYRALVLLVISCPCALVVSTPVAIVSGITRATRDGVLVKGGAFLELAGTVRTLVFDKTGTLTQGRPEVAEVVPIAEADPDAVLALAASLEVHSNHPLASAVVKAAGEREQLPVADLSETPGRGVSALVDGRALAIGSLGYVRGLGVKSADALEQAERLESEGLTVLALAEIAQDLTLGLIGIADAVRPQAASALAALRSAGIERTVMLTGDNERAAERVAREVGVTEFRARLLPDDKTTAVAELREQYGLVAMVGDGVNDAPALAAADIGIAMGAAGSHTAIETADVALMRDDLSALPGFLDLGKRTMANIRQNVALSIGVKALVLVLALTGTATLWMAVFADSGVALIVIANGLRLLKSR